MEQHRADYVESKETGEILQVQKSKKFDDKNCGAKSQVLGCLETLLLIFHGLRCLKCHWYRWDRTPEKWPILCAQLTLVLSEGFGPNDLQKCLPTPAVLCFCGSNFSVCPQSCFTSLHLVISHSTGINTLFPGTGSSAGSGWSSPPTWRSVRCLTVFTLPVTKPLFGKHKNFLLLQYFYPGAGWKSPERPSLTKATCGESPCL